ncbi:MAG: NAD(P)H-hydrate dehydratase [Deltaproteobacteria bacterium]|nr:NAD(P)H-hydrate dehydratase [Deltaproteobacteria bacterium]MBW2139620.1 NAD(P)H-hydrate dehydratase [Deltaproteobacteria bacterium]
MHFVTAEEMRRLDNKTISECGVPGVVLMENAGRGAAVLAQEHFGLLTGRSIAVISGRGNNGGDGFVMARVFHGWGAHVRIYLLGSRDQVNGDARINLEIAFNLDLEIVEVSEDSGPDRIDLSNADMIIDAILGTGLNAEVRGLYREVIDRINKSGRTVVAVDVPSGLDSDTGRIWGSCVRADLTVTFGLPKAGLFLPPGEVLVGRLEVVDIGIPPQVMAEIGQTRELLLEDNLKGLLKSRDLDGHKGHYGHVLIVAGSTGKTGAAALTSLAAAKSGAGLTTLAVPGSLNTVLEEKVTEVMTEPLPESEPGYLAPNAIDRILELAEGKSVLALGPGISTQPGSIEVVRGLVEHCELPLVIDADGLNALAGSTDLLKKAKREVVLTPHPGEMSRLAGMTVIEIQSNRLSSAVDFAKAHGVVLILKGYRTVIGVPDGRTFLNTTGGPHMASGGMGDVLTGIVAGLVSQGLSVTDASRLGVFIHGLAADEAAAAKGPIGLLASDLLAWLSGLWSRFIA